MTTFFKDSSYFYLCVLKLLFHCLHGWGMSLIAELKKYICVHLCVSMCTCVQVPVETRRGWKPPSAEVTVGYELSSVGVRNWTWGWILYRSSIHSWLLSHLFSHSESILIIAFFITHEKFYFRHPSSHFLAFTLNLSHAYSVKKMLPCYLFIWEG